MKHKVLFGIGTLIVCLIIGVWMRERSWRNLLIQKDGELVEKQEKLENALELLKIERANNEFNTLISFEFAQKCLKSEILFLKSSIIGENSTTVTEMIMNSLQECHQGVVGENLKLAPTTVAQNNTSTSVSNERLSLFTSFSLFDRSGMIFFFLILFLTLSEAFSVYNISALFPSSFRINGKDYDRTDFLEKALFKQLEIFLIKDHPIAGFLFFSLVFIFLSIIYSLSCVMNWSNLFYYFLLHRLIGTLALLPIANMATFLVYNFVTIYFFLRKLYAKSIITIVQEQYQKREFWVLILTKAFNVYDTYSLLTMLFWFSAQFCFFFPLFLIYFYQDTLYAQTNLESAHLNVSNNFLLITLLQSTIPFSFAYYCLIITVIRPFISFNSSVNLHENIIFSSHTSWLRLVFNFILRKGWFLFDGDSSSLAPADQKTLKSNDMKIGLVFFFCVGNSVLYLIRFLYFMIFCKLTTTWFAWLINWCFPLFHLFILLYTLPTINILLYKYEIARKYRPSFKSQIEAKLQENAEQDNKKKKDQSASANSLDIVEEEIHLGMGLFDFALHKAVLYCLFIHHEDAEDGTKLEVTEKLERVFTSFLQSDAFAFSVKFAQSTENSSYEEEVNDSEEFETKEDVEETGNAD